MKLFIALLIIGLGSYYVWQRYTLASPQSLYGALDFYGWKSSKQKEALRFLMQTSGIQNVDDLLDNKAKDKNDLTQSILQFVNLAQDKFTIRSGNQERWDVQTADWMKDPSLQPKILEALTTLNMMQAVLPHSPKTDVICILGATRSPMRSRIEYAAELFDNDKLKSDWLVLLAGERYVTPDKKGIMLDGSEQELANLGAKLGKELSLLTETDLIKEAYETSSLYGKLETVTIDTPRGNLTRPTTETTVIDFCHWLKEKPEIHKVTFVSNQPHIEYQKAIIAEVFKQEGINVSFEVIGPQYNASVLDNQADKINYILQELGSRIWASTPGVIESLELTVSHPEIKEAFLELYKKHPLIYHYPNS